MKLEFSRQIFPKHSQTKNFMKIHSAEAEFFHAEGRTYMREKIIAFRNVAKAPTMYYFASYVRKWPETDCFYSMTFASMAFVKEFVFQNANITKKRLISLL
jgi:hypothetical protein